MLELKNYIFVFQDTSHLCVFQYHLIKYLQSWLTLIVTVDVCECDYVRIRKNVSTIRFYLKYAYKIENSNFQ